LLNRKNVKLQQERKGIAPESFGCKMNKKITMGFHSNKALFD
jgi:hypothetical protein